MKDKWISRLAQVNKELLLIFSIVASAALVNFFVEGQRLVLTFYNLPTLFAVYYFGRRRAVQASVATILFVDLGQRHAPDALQSRSHSQRRPPRMVRPGNLGRFPHRLCLCHRNSSRA